MQMRALEGLLPGLLQGLPRAGDSVGGGAPHCSPAACGVPSPSGTACKQETLFQGNEGSEPGEGDPVPGTAQQPRAHGVALPGLGRAKGWSFDGKREVRGTWCYKLRVLWVLVHHPPSCSLIAGDPMENAGALELDVVGCSSRPYPHLPWNLGLAT